jgi:hypothetical protein
MPYYQMDEEEHAAGLAQGFGSESDSSISYEPARGEFDSDELTGTAKTVYQSLRKLTITAIRCRYNGGWDEGFAEFGEAVLDGTTVTAEELGRRLADGPLGNVPEEGAESYSYDLSREDRAKEALDDFAFVLAAAMLGEGYGTGSYSMHGAFSVNLETCKLRDEEELSDNERE